MGFTSTMEAAEPQRSTGMRKYAEPSAILPYTDSELDLAAAGNNTPDSPVSVSIESDEEGPSNSFHFDETTIIFDWDDTLLSSSWLAQNGLRLDVPSVVPAEAAAQLDLLQESVIALMERAAKCGNVVIITNAETGWVEMSCKKFMPRVLPMLNGVRVLSARSAFEVRFPDSPSDWKVQAFFQEICGSNPGAALPLGVGHHAAAMAACAHSAATGLPPAPGLRHPAVCAAAAAPRNILSFGDSIHERAAIHKVTSVLGRDVRTKSIKFVERPTVEQLKRQVDLVASCFDAIVGHGESLDLMLTIHLLYQ